MLDIEVIVPPEDSGLDIVSRAGMKKHLRISATVTKLDDVIDQAVTDAADKLHGINGELNRTLFPTTFKRYLSKFPGNDKSGKPKPIMIPYPPLLQFIGITIEDGSSPENVVDPAEYVVKSGMLVPEIHPRTSWPTVTEGPRAVSITYRNGYEEYPPKLARMIKFLAAHYIENAEATILEQNKTLIDRNVLFAMDDLRAALAVPKSYDDWNE
ncbi:hypothetical protein [Mesorhizobium silamurunense]|uniref:hypothetical protein n=1 Tax=Mesorhizobium silamurunense TaxID=499528 RepID=UPI001785B669|nr:hypothetical protein [Mesorhizobium silamurunense]